MLLPSYCRLMLEASASASGIVNDHFPNVSMVSWYTCPAADGTSSTVLLPLSSNTPDATLAPTKHVPLTLLAVLLTYQRNPAAAVPVMSVASMVRASNHLQRG